MHCAKCGEELNATDRFCGKCGAVNLERTPLASGAAPAPSMDVSPKQQTQLTQGNKSLRIALVAVLICVVGVAAWLLWKKSGVQPAVQAAGPIVKIPSSIAFMGENSIPAEQRSPGPGGSPALVERAQRLAASNPRDAKTLNDAGVLMQSAGDSQQANNLLNQAHQLAPQDPIVDYNYARNLYELGRIDEAIQQAQSALAQKSDFDEAHVLLADAAIQKKDYAAAEDNVNKLKQAIKEIEIAAFTIRGVILLEKGKVQEAKNMFQEALKLAGDDSTALYNAGVAEQRANNLSAAQDFYQRALGIDPSMAEAHNNLGTVLMGLGRDQEAFDQFHAAAISDPGNKLFAGNLSQTGNQGPEDKIVGTWQLEGGEGSLAGSINGHSVSQTIPIPAGERITFTKVSGAYTLQASFMGMQLSTTFREQPDGSYSAPTAEPEQLKGMFPPGTTHSGTVTFWVRGDRLFGDTIDSLSGASTMINGKVTWRAKRASP